jgi:predicted GNAT family N-acyltransferase
LYYAFKTFIFLKPKLKIYFGYSMEEPRLNIVCLSESHQKQAINLMVKVFTLEQDVPADYLPVREHPQKSWGIWDKNELIALSIAWKEDDLWHWGRYAVDPDWRGKGLGKQLAYQSLKDLFDIGVEEIHIDARDITLKLLSQFGAKVVGETFDFYGPVTPMRLYVRDFLACAGQGNIWKI